MNVKKSVYPTVIRWILYGYHTVKDRKRLGNDSTTTRKRFGNGSETGR